MVGCGLLVDLVWFIVWLVDLVVGLFGGLLVCTRSVLFRCLGWVCLLLLIALMFAWFDR